LLIVSGGLNGKSTAGHGIHHDLANNDVDGIANCDRDTEVP